MGKIRTDDRSDTGGIRAGCRQGISRRCAGYRRRAGLTSGSDAGRAQADQTGYGLGAGKVDPGTDPSRVSAEPGKDRPDSDLGSIGCGCDQAENRVGIRLKPRSKKGSELPLFSEGPGVSGGLIVCGRQAPSEFYARAHARICIFL